MNINPVFDEAERLDKLNKLGDLLVHLTNYIDFEFFRPSLGRVFVRENKNAAGRPPFDVVFMFKVLSSRCWCCNSSITSLIGSLSIV
jgi:hypothetical protein